MFHPRRRRLLACLAPVGGEEAALRAAGTDVGRHLLGRHDAHRKVEPALLNGYAQSGQFTLGSSIHQGAVKFRVGQNHLDAIGPAGSAQQDRLLGADMSGSQDAIDFLITSIIS